MDSAPARFVLDSTASAAELDEVFRRIGACCRQAGARSALVAVMGAPALSRDQFLDAVDSLTASCEEGFRLAWVAQDRETFERLTPSEYPTKRSGVIARVFFEEANARRWLSW